MDDTIVLTSDNSDTVLEDGITADSPSVSYYGAGGPTALDTLTSIDISNLNLNSISTITLPGATVGGIIGNNCHINWNTTVPNTCYTTGTGTTYATGTGYNWGSNNVGVQVPENSDIKIGDRSLKTFMEKVEERLAILVPDQQKLEKFAALKKAYEHYKTLESLCFIEEDVEQK
jgi:hypothetical protein